MIKLVIYLMVLLILLSGCEQKNRREHQHRTGPEQGKQDYELPQAGKLIKFPQDHLPHLKYRHEWWYLTANLETESGQVLAAQWTLFRTAVNQRHWYFGHAALADAKRHANAFRHGRTEFANVTISSKPFSARIDDWLWQSSSDLLPATVSFGDNSDAKENWQAELSLTSSITPPAHFFLQGAQGYSRKHPSLNIGSHYYSQPFIDVSGRVLWQGKWQQVTGTAWFDREWGSQLLAPDQQGWDWFSLHLDKKTALMVYRIRSTTQDYIYGSLMYRDGSSIMLTSNEINIDATALGQIYPKQFRLQVENFGIDIKIKIVNESQINRFWIEYFEGMATFSGSHQGRGFVEMTGYR